MSVQPQVSNYDAVIVVSFGGPEGMDDVMPFLENVLRGRNVPHARLKAVAKHYEVFGGVSPINRQNRALIAGLERELKINGPHLPIYFGNRNWHPFLEDTLRQMRADGVKKALAFVTSAYSSYSSCRQYLENIHAAREAIGDKAPTVDKIRAFYNHPEFIRANADQIRTALAKFAPDSRVHVIFTAHSIPLAMAENCDYEKQLQEAAGLILNELSGHELSSTLAYQSRSGSPDQRWLEPDICDHLKVLHSEGIRDVLIAPIGFVSDHMEVLYDLDFEAHRLCDTLDIRMERAQTAGTHPRFIKMVRELIIERMDENSERSFLGTSGARPNECSLSCCASSRTT
jgi:ferrochelatase